VGLTTASITLSKDVCWEFIMVEWVIIVAGRFMSVYLSYYICTCNKKQSHTKLSFKELTFLSYSACIRGAIAFGLVMQIDSDLGAEFINKDVIESSTFILIILSTVIFGTFTPLVKNFLLKEPE